MLSSTKKSLASTYHTQLDTLSAQQLIGVPSALLAAYQAENADNEAVETWTDGCLPLPEALRQLAAKNPGAANRVEEELHRIGKFVLASPDMMLDRNLRHGAKVLLSEGLCATSQAAQEASAEYIALCQQAKESAQRSANASTNHTYAYLAHSPANKQAGSAH